MLQGISSSDKELALLLIKTMICSNPTGRPPASAICNYPIFWNPAKILSFFQVKYFNIVLKAISFKVNSHITIVSNYYRNFETKT